MKVVLLCQNQDPLRSALRRPATSQNLAGYKPAKTARQTSALDIDEVLIGATDSHIHLFVADVIKSFATVDRVSCIGS